MPQLTNPENTLRAFQRALDSQSIPTQPGSTDASLLVHMDMPEGQPRVTYARLEGKKVASLVVFCMSESIEPGVPCFGIGYAVHPRYRGEGRARSIVEAAIKEFQNGMRRNGVEHFHVEAVVGASNAPSQRVASAVISQDARPGQDALSAEKIFAYVRKI